MPEVSVIIAIYNVEQYLAKCLDSVTGQTCGDIQIIAVNDGSSDNSLRIIQEYAKKDSRITIVDKPNGGLSDARNEGMKVAIGKYLAFLDGDDCYETEFIAKMLGKAKEKDFDLICCNYAYVWEDSRKPVEKNFLGRLQESLNREDAIAAFLKQEIIGSVAIKLFKKEICDQFNLTFPKGQNWEDITFTFQYIGHCKEVGIIKEALYRYLQMERSITQKKDSLSILDIMKASGGCVEMCEKLYTGKYRKESRALLSRSFICLLVYAFKCRNKEITCRLKQELKKEDKRISIELLNWQEKALILLYRTNYNLSRFVFFRIYKRNQNA